MFFIKISYSVIVLTYLMSAIENIKLYGMNQFSLFISVLFLGLYFIKEKIGIFPNKKARNLFFYMIFIFFVYQLLNINEYYINESLNDCIRNLLVIINIYMFSRYISFKRCEEKFIKLTYLIMSMFICYIYIYNFDNFEGLKQIFMVFDNLNRYRNSYGLVHPNSTGLSCYLALILSFYLYNRPSIKNVWFKTLMFGFNIVISIVLISTASRTAITSLILFLLVFYFIKIKSKIDVNKDISILVKTIMLCVGIILIISIIYNIQGIDYIELFSKTNRVYNFTINIPILFNYHKELFGMGRFEIFTDRYIGTSYIDNWYLYMLLTSGIIGLILSIILVSNVYFSISKNSKNSLLENFTISYFFSQIYYSLFETMFFNSKFLNTFVFWIFIFTTLNYKNQKVKVNL